LEAALPALEAEELALGAEEAAVQEPATVSVLAPATVSVLAPD